MRDCYYERDSGIGVFEERDSGNNHLNEPRTGMSVDENLWRNWSSQPTKSTRRTGSLALRRRSGCSATLFESLCDNENYIRSEVPINQKFKEFKTAASVEMLNGLENPHRVRLLKKLCKSSKRWLKGDNPLGGVLFYKSKFLVSFTWDGKQRWQ